MRFNLKTFVFFLLLISITLYFILNHISFLLYNPDTAVTIENQGPLFDPNLFRAGTPNPPGQNHSLIIVTGHLPNEDVTWLARDLPSIPTAIYPVGSPNTPLPANKGHEAMIYLTYILDHYPSFPDVVLFIHPHLIAWHNDVLHSSSTLVTITRLSLPHVIRQGYFNTRCHLHPGCPSWLSVDRPLWRLDVRYKPEERFLTSSVFHALHGPHTPIPAHISQPCCAQFAVSRDRLLSRPQSFYTHYRDWLLNTDLPDDTSGRIMEYTWQYIFTGLFEHCPSPHQCYCDGYGVCFEGRENGLQRWLKVWKTKDSLDERMTKLRKKGKMETRMYKALMEESERIGGMLDGLREEAIERGRNPRLRAESAWRLWTADDGY